MKLTTYIRAGIYTAALAAVALGSVALTAGCATTINIKSTKPARVYIGANPQVGIVEIAGGGSELQDAIAYELVRQSKGQGFFVIKERMKEGINFEIQNNMPIVRGANSISDADVFLKARIVEIGSAITTEKRPRSVKHGDQSATEYYEAELLDSTVVITFSLTGPQRVYMKERKYSGRVKGDKDKGKTVEKALSQAVGKFIADITPSFVNNDVKMDKSDKGQKQLLLLIKDGNLDLARKQLEALILKNPHNEAALYNLAVINDAVGEYEKAISLYDKAISKVDKGFYLKARQACLGRLSALNIAGK